MDYAQYVSRRPPSPPPLYNPHKSLIISASLSAASSLSVESRQSQNPLPPIRTTASVSAHLHRRALRDEYAALASIVNASADADAQRDRQEAVRIRLEDMLTQADHRAVRVLNLALEKCNAKLDSLAASTRNTDDARARMRVIESKHFHGARAPTNVPPELRAMHIRREGIATLVEHINCTLHDQVRIHFMLQELADKLKYLKTLLYSLNRTDREPSASHSPPSTPTARHHASGNARRHGLPRRSSRGAFRTPSHDRFSSADHNSLRGNSLRSQRSLPRRAEGSLIPFVVKRALSYNATPENISPDDVPGGHATSNNTSWWNEADQAPPRPGSEPRLNAANHRPTSPQAPNYESDFLPNSDMTRKLSPQRSAYPRDGRQDSHESDEAFGASPVSCCTNESEHSPKSKQMRLKPHASAMDQSVLLDIDSLCTEASSVLSSSRGMDSEKPSRRGSISSSLFTAMEPRKRSKGFGRLRLGRLRVPSQIKKLWIEVNDLYGIILTHGPHLVEEKIVSAASMETGILGTWNPLKKGRGFRHHVNFQTGNVVEAIRRADSIVAWQQRLIVAIRRDQNEQRKSLRHADNIISHAYLQSLDSTSIAKA